MTLADAVTRGAVAQDATRILAGFAAGLDVEDLPDEVVHEAKRALLDWVAVTLAGAREPSTEIMVGVLRENGGRGEALLIGREETLGAPFAALVNGFAAHIHDYDDTYNPPQTTFHGSAPLWPVIAALSTDPGTSGRTALAAFVAGFELMARIGAAAGPGHYEGGWHVTGTIGHVAAAATAGRVLGMGPETLAGAMGLAGTQAAGIKESHGTDGKPLHAGKAAMDGLLSTLLVQAGMTGAPTILEGKFGILQTMAPDPDPEPLFDQLGTLWHLPDNGYKAYPSGSLTHPTMDAVLELRSQHGFTADDVTRVIARVHSYAAAVTRYLTPTNRLEGRFSITHGAAVALLSDYPSIDQYTDDAVNDPRAASLRELVEIVVDDSVGKQGATVTIVLSDGRELTTTVLHNRGVPANPLTDDDLAAKFTAIASLRLGDRPTQRLLELIWGVTDLADFGEVVRLASGQPHPASGQPHPASGQPR